MDCAQLARRIENLLPDAAPVDVARWCLVILNLTAGNPARLDGEKEFAQLWNEAHIRFNAARDQHDATQAELDGLARSDPKKFSADQIWILVRALKVQSQLLQLFTRQPLAEVATRAQVNQEIA